MIEERNELLAGSEATSETVKISSEIRKALREIEKNASDLQGLQKAQEGKLQKRKEKGKQVSPADEQEVALRADVVELAFQHIEECHTLEKSVYKGSMSTTSFVGLTDPNEKAPLSLPDLDDERFLLLKKKDTEIDAELDNVSKGVNVLRNMAEHMGQEIELQGVMINEITGQVDHANAHLDTLNKRLKGILNKYRKGDRFCIDFILICVICGIAAYLYNAIKG